MGNFTARSRFARECPEAVLRCFELGYLTIRESAGTWTNVIRITQAGLDYLAPLNYTPEESIARSL